MAPGGMTERMRQAARITLFVQDRNGKLDTYPDPQVLDALMRQVPLVTRNPDGSRTLVFDLAEPADAIGRPEPPPAIGSEGLRAQLQTLANQARALGLPLTASLAEAAELVVEVELSARTPPRQQG
jgi:hypothetical protein